VSDHRFGISTHLFHETRLTRDHLVEIAAHGFEAVEVFATRSHFDYGDDRARQELSEWLGDTRLQLHSMHAPIVDAMRNGEWVGAYSIASADEARRQAAVDQARTALDVARVAPYRFLVLHVGMPAADRAPSPRDNDPRAARRSIEEIAAHAETVGVTVALEVIPNDLSSPAALTRLIEDDLELPNVGVCLDYGHAHLLGDVTDALDAISGHLLTTHVHDNRGRRDDHLVPFQGTIDWDSALMFTQKVGYDGVLMLEVADAGNPADVLRRCQAARQRLESMFVTF
jgi:sugar phosphate isomerase/epimerase